MSTATLRHGLQRRVARRRFGRALLLLCGTASALSALPRRLAASPLGNGPIPAYGKPGFVRSQWQYAALPAATAFRQQAEVLAQRLDSGTEPDPDLDHRLREGRQAWIATLHAWLRLSTVAMGPLLARRSVKALDFDGLRPEYIRRAVMLADAASLDAATMERIGSPAKGLPALEYLLWSGPDEVPRGPALWHYLDSVAREMAAEAKDIEQAWQEKLAAPLDEAAAQDGLSEFLNQVVGSIERLRWRDIERPMYARGSRNDTYPRSRSAQTAAAWESAWSTLRQACRTPGTPGTWPEPGQAQVPLALYLRSQGHGPLADQLDGLLQSADRAMQALRPQDPQARQLAASKTLAQLRTLLETEVAWTLKVRMGFTDNDGD